MDQVVINYDEDDKASEDAVDEFGVIEDTSKKEPAKASGKAKRRAAYKKASDRQQYLRRNLRSKKVKDFRDPDVELNLSYYTESMSSNNLEENIRLQRRVELQSADTPTMYDPGTVNSPLEELDRQIITSQGGTPPATPVTQVSQAEQIYMDHSIAIARERVNKFNTVLDEMIGNSALQDKLERIDAPKVDGRTREETIDYARRLKKEGQRNVEKAMRDVLATGLAGATTGAMAIGLNTGLNPAQEWAAGTFAGSLGMQGFGLQNQKKTIKVQDKYGNLRDVTIDAFGASAAVADMVDKIQDGSAYRMEDLRNFLTGARDGASTGSTDSHFIESVLGDIQMQLDDATRADEIKKEAEDARQEEIAKRRTGRFANAMNNRRNNP